MSLRTTQVKVTPVKETKKQYNRALTIPRPGDNAVYVIKATVHKDDVSNPSYAATHLNSAIRLKLNKLRNMKEVTPKEYRRARKVIG